MLHLSVALLAVLDPYAKAMRESRRAAVDPSVVERDPDHFKKVFGKLAIEQNNFRAIDAAQHVTAEDRCIACHAAVNELEKALRAKR